MQCVSCRFENMPGVEVCGRCGSSLRLAAAVDVHPPRATAWQKRMRRIIPTRRLSAGLSAAATAAVRGARDATRPLGIELPERGRLARLLVPGWAQSSGGDVLPGRCYFWVYLALLLSGLLFWGTTLSGILLGLAFSVHASSALDIMLRCPGDYPYRLIAGLLVMAVLGVGVYFPAGWLLTRVADRRCFDDSAGAFQAGDVVLWSHWTYARSAPEPGDVVVAVMPRAGAAGVLIAGGEFIDRVLAGPGADVVWEKGVLSVDGAASPWQPINPARLPERLAFRVPEQYYLVFPSTAWHTGPAHNAAFWQQLSCIRADHILGRVYLRNQPLWRFGFVR